MIAAAGQYQMLKRVWERLPAGDLGDEAETLGRICEVAGLRPGDDANASVVRLMLANLGALKATVGEGGPRFERSESFPPFVDCSPGTPAYNAALRRAHEEERQRREREERLAEEAARTLRAPLEALERAAINSYIDQRLKELGLFPEPAQAGSHS